MRKKVVRFIKRLKAKGFRVFIPSIYAFLVLIGVLAYIINLFAPKIEVCPTFFGAKVCAPIGVYIVLVSSMPGYFLVGKLIGIASSVAWYVSLVFVLLASFLIYYLIGVFIDGYKAKKTSTERIIWTVAWSFSALLIILLLLVF